MISALDLFRIGIGPSSSHTVGPIRIANAFLADLSQRGEFERIAKITVELQGSLALTGPGHGTPDACLMGLCGFEPETIDIEAARKTIELVQAERSITLPGDRQIEFDPRRDIDLACHVIPELHPNGMVLTAYDSAGETIERGEYYSTGGGFFASAAVLSNAPDDDLISAGRNVRFPFASAAELLAICEAEQLSIAQIVRTNEAAFRKESETEEGLDRIATEMMNCIHAGLAREGELPGSLRVKRRARGIYEKLRSRERPNEAETLMDWLNLFAMAVNEENASGHRVVTAPTNGAAGIIPAVIRYYCYNDGVLETSKARDFLLTAAGIGLLYKQRASISGAEMGCQGEVGVACSMAAGGLAAIWGGEPMHVTTAAEIGMEHNLGLTCDPVGGLVQIPCIERNALAAVKAVNAARLALHAGSEPRVSLDQVIETMRQTGIDMSNKYKETSLGGLAVNVVAC
ncbi:L-serine ammonia-lyase [Erythrobacter sp. YT30]|uniref:L-serine ammonia-lyase n=1 Tax=Erythrobacter sp. YT30 TaxID=1735012 RepID=UPI00076C6E97|nr:L-serine ammonia-lyase [Erythrobacter sp. YT30]KWV92918.1 serine dehydratase [Erythrobacter sp. YT30]